MPKKKFKNTSVKDLDLLKKLLPEGEKTKELSPDMENSENKITKSMKQLDTEHNISIPEAFNSQPDGNGEIIDLKAKAPYNFIPLNKREEIINTKLEDILLNENKYHHFKTGYIDVLIKAETPIYIRNKKSKELALKLIELQKIIDDDNTNTLLRNDSIRSKLDLIYEFYGYKSKYFIPGSSLRGLISNICEIVTYGRFINFDYDKRFHYRAMADFSHDTRKSYTQNILTGNQQQGYSQIVKSGYLIKENNNFYICPTDYTLNNCWFFRVEEKDVIDSHILHQRMATRRTVNNNIQYKANDNYKIGFKKIKFTFDTERIHRHSRNLKYAKVLSIHNENDNNIPPNAVEGILVHSGYIPSRNRQGKHLHWVIGPKNPANKRLLIPESVISNYRNDKNKDKSTNILEWFKKFNAIEVPCFYISETINDIEHVKAIGHTGIFRLPYKNKLTSFVSKNHINEKISDLTENIFGNKSDFSGRVFFEDLSFLKSSNEFKMNAVYPNILSNPKPTTFQHYLVQKEINLQFSRPINNIPVRFNGVTGLKDYNSDEVSIRGYKSYWHKNPENWFKDEIENDKLSQYTKIKPFKEGATFSGRIRFENLTDVELGALLFAIDLPEKMCHKIGMGKPLGLGSIRITPDLHLSEREKRYKELKAEWAHDIPKCDKQTITDYKNKFAAFILEKLGRKFNENNKELWLELWKEKRLQQLQAMLYFNVNLDPDQINQIRYMKIDPRPNEFRNRPILPQPSDVNPGGVIIK